MADGGFWPDDPKQDATEQDEAAPDAAPEEDGAQDDGPRDDAALAVAARHALHDEELIAAFATDGLDEDSQVERARSLIERCTACRDLHHDISAIGAAIRVDAKGTMTAPRDFRLTVEDAQRLGGAVRAGGTVRVDGFAARLRQSMTSFAAPIGASMAALGIVGLLVGSAALGGRASSAPVSAGGPTATNAPAQLESASGQPGPKSTDRSSAYQPASSTFGTGGDTPTPSDAAATDSNPAAWLLAGSVTLLVAGIVLLFVTFRRGRA